LAAKKKAATKKAAKKKKVVKRGDFYIYIVRRPHIDFEANEKDDTPHKVSDEEDVLKQIAGGLKDMKDCEAWLREYGLEYNGERILIMHKKVDKKLDLQVRTTLKFG
jgi:hypothetical protein